MQNAVTRLSRRRFYSRFGAAPLQCNSSCAYFTAIWFRNGICKGIHEDILMGIRKDIRKGDRQEVCHKGAEGFTSAVAANLIWRRVQCAFAAIYEGNGSHGKYDAVASTRKAVD